MLWALARVSFSAAKIVSCNNKKYFHGLPSNLLLFTFVYFCLLLSAFVYFCLLLFTFVYFCLLLFTLVVFCLL
jgi:hypothetical protein